MNNKVTQLDSYVTAKQLAQSLGLSKSGFYSLYKRGVIPSGVKIGHSRRWNVSEVKAVLSAMNDNEVITA